MTLSGSIIKSSWYLWKVLLYFRVFSAAVWNSPLRSPSLSLSGRKTSYNITFGKLWKLTPKQHANLSSRNTRRCTLSGCVSMWPDTKGHTLFTAPPAIHKITMYCLNNLLAFIAPIWGFFLLIYSLFLRLMCLGTVPSTGLDLTAASLRADNLG